MENNNDKKRKQSGPVPIKPVIKVLRDESNKSPTPKPDRDLLKARGKVFRLCRNNAGYSLENACDKEHLDISVNTMAAIEAGRHEPNIELLVKMAFLYGVTIDKLVGYYPPYWNVTYDLSPMIDQGSPYEDYDARIKTSVGGMPFRTEKENEELAEMADALIPDEDYMLERGMVSRFQVAKNKKDKNKK